jgi:vancomycin resistance protein YoaR
MVKKNAQSPPKPVRRRVTLYVLLFAFTGLLICVGVVGGSVYQFEQMYKDKIYPGVRIDGIPVGGKTANDIEHFYTVKSDRFKNLMLTLTFEDKIATISGNDLKVSYDGKLSATQAYSIGRSANILSDLYQTWRTAMTGTNLTSVLSMNTEIIDDTLQSLSSSIDIAPQDAQFQFENNKVTAFKLSKPGRKMDIATTKKQILAYVDAMTKQDSQMSNVPIEIAVNTIQPAITTETSNDKGIKELLAVGTSKFAHSIPGRIHNVELATSRINGRLVPPDSNFSFNDALGDVSAATGYAQAYIIKEGRTVLGDGGGVCQVSTTLFRAAMNAGLPITERHAHAYRVGYYEEDSPPGIDATVFAPGYDLKFKNDTGHWLLIQTKTDLDNLALTFEIYGTSDGRKAEVTKPVILSQIAAPPPVNQDDPTLPVGTVKQVDFAAAGAKVTFEYKVTRDNVVINKQTFLSNYQPWAAVYLRGTKT